MVTQRRLPGRPAATSRRFDTFGPLDTTRASIVVDRLVNPSHVTSLFDGSRRGKPVVRPDDMAALRVELVNLTIIAGTPPLVRYRGAGKAFVVLHFAPQSLGEQAFFQAAQPSRTGQPPDETVDTPRGLKAGALPPSIHRRYWHALPANRG